MSVSRLLSIWVFVCLSACLSLYLVVFQYVNPRTLSERFWKWGRLRLTKIHWYEDYLNFRVNQTRHIFRVTLVFQIKFLVRGILNVTLIYYFLSRSWLRGGGERWKTFRAIGKRRTMSLHSRRRSAWNYETVIKHPIPVILVNIVLQAGNWSLHLGIAAWHHGVGCKRCMSGGTETRGRLRGWGYFVPLTSPKSYATRAAVSRSVS